MLATLLRTAASEAPSLEWGLRTHSPLQATRCMAKSAHGFTAELIDDCQSSHERLSEQRSETSSEAGLQLSQLVVSMRADDQKSSHSMRHAPAISGIPHGDALAVGNGDALLRRQVLITGGTGALGSAIACWQAGSAPCATLQLTGTSGRLTRPQPGFRALLKGTATLTIEASSLAGAESAAFLLAGRGAETPLGLLMHAGGVLQDGLISAQTPG